jgi:tetratricopeptide (TPR) repeat protein
LGSLYADAGQLQQAERASRVAIDLLPGVAEPRINLANALISQGKQVEATALCNSIKADDPAHPGIWHSLGLAYKALGRIQDAEQCLTAVTRSDPRNSAAFCALGEIKAAQDEVAQALSLYRKARELDPADPRVHFQLGKVLLPNSSARHAELVERLQIDHQYHDISEARNIARELATGFRYDDDGVERAVARFFDEYDPSHLYPVEWWTDALMRFGDRKRASDTALRSIYSTVFSWSLPCRQALDEIAASCGKRLASYGSGSGYWEWLLCTHYGIDVVCHDMALRHRFLPTKEVLHSDATVDPEDTIFLAWLPGEAAIDPAIESLLDRFEPGQELVLVGEPADDAGHPRTCGTYRFFRYLQDKFETRATVPLANYAYFHDRVDLLVRR